MTLQKRELTVRLPKILRTMSGRESVPHLMSVLFGRDPNATSFSGPSYVDIYVWDFASRSTHVYAQFRRGNGFGLINGVFSPDGRWLLMGAKPGLNSPGFTAGIVLIDFEESYRKFGKVLS